MTWEPTVKSPSTRKTASYLGLPLVTSLWAVRSWLSIFLIALTWVQYIKAWESVKCHTNCKVSYINKITVGALVNIWLLLRISLDTLWVSASPFFQNFPLPLYIFAPSFSFLFPQAACSLLVTMTTLSTCGMFWRELVFPPCLVMKTVLAEWECHLMAQHSPQLPGIAPYGWAGLSLNGI